MKERNEEQHISMQDNQEQTLAQSVSSLQELYRRGQYLQANIAKLEEYAGQCDENTEAYLVAQKQMEWLQAEVKYREGMLCRRLPQVPGLMPSVAMWLGDKLAIRPNCGGSLPSL